MYVFSVVRRRAVLRPRRTLFLWRAAPPGGGLLVLRRFPRPFRFLCPLRFPCSAPASVPVSVSMSAPAAALCPAWQKNQTSLFFCSRLSLSLEKTGCGSAESNCENFVFICLCSRLSVSLYGDARASLRKLHVMSSSRLPENRVADFSDSGIFFKHLRPGIPVEPLRSTHRDDYWLFGVVE